MYKILKITALFLALLGGGFWYMKEYPKIALQHATIEIDTTKLKNRLKLTPAFPYKVLQEKNSIQWESLPKFSLPEKFTLVFQGARMANETVPEALLHGFTHLDASRMRDNDFRTLPIKKRAWLMGANYFNQFGSRFADHGAGGADPFWDTDEKFKFYLSNLGGLCESHFHDCPPQGYLATVDIFCWDVENVWYTPSRQVLAPNSPGFAIPDAQFEQAYKTAMAKKYRMMLQDARNSFIKTTRLGSYNPGCPTEIGNLNPENYTNIHNVTWLWREPAGADGKNFTDYMDFQTPGGYFTPDNVKYNDGMYMIVADQEVNAKWSKIPRIPLQWVFTTPPNSFEVPLAWAEAMPIFTFLSGAKGAWFWDDMDKMVSNQPTEYNLFRNFSGYHAYISGLYRLSKHNALLSQNFEPIIPEVSFDGGKTFQILNAAELSKKSLPIVRAVVTNNKILLAAFNPAAKSAQDKVSLVVRRGKWMDVITLRGQQVLLGEATL
jgi:hypothetical protein